jgi:hypothetical protein
MTERIALDLATSGTFSAEMPADPAQRVVDVWWAARAAARRLHERVDIRTGVRPAASGQRVMITVLVQPAATGAPLPTSRAVERRVARVEP